MYIIEKCKLKQKPFFLQTNILKSMTTRVKPTVTEISNLAYSVKVGFDGLILKEELTMAHNYVYIVKFLIESLRQIESLNEVKSTYEDLSKFYDSNRESSTDKDIETLLNCAVKSTFDIPIAMIILNSNDFNLAKALSKFRPSCLEIFITSNKLIFDYLRLIRGIYPQLIEIENFANLRIEKNFIEDFCLR